ncbi:hypothetical protein [Bifidobacterium longum]|uniref:hypothetical protein n=1 Tax=Bifidobacterium longum TaxID=216816 RepID=UPI0015A629AD|nr:hypothetical protein [Bifidobacterium longum]
MDGIEDSKRAATLRAIWPAVLHAMRGNQPTVFWLAAATGHAYPIPKSLVNRLPGSAHGTRATTTPCSAHASRGAKPMSSTPWRPKSWWRRRRRRPRRRTQGTCARSEHRGAASGTAPGPPARERDATGNRPPARPQRPCL